MGLGMVFYISAKLNSISAEKARNLFYIYAGLMGLSLSSLLLIYTGASVVRAFFVSSSFRSFVYLWLYYKKIPFRLRIVPYDGSIWTYNSTDSQYFYGLNTIRFYYFYCWGINFCWLNCL